MRTVLHAFTQNECNVLLDEQKKGFRIGAAILIKGSPWFSFGGILEWNIVVTGEKLLVPTMF